MTDVRWRLIDSEMEYEELMNSGTVPVLGVEYRLNEVGNIFVPRARAEAQHLGQATHVMDIAGRDGTDRGRRMMALYRSKPSTIEAVQWTGTTLSSSYVDDFALGKVRAPSHDQLFLLAGKDGAQEWVPVPVGHWLVCQPGDKTDIWPVDPDYFAAKYEPAGWHPDAGREATDGD